MHLLYQFESPRWLSSRWGQSHRDLNLSRFLADALTISHRFIFALSCPQSRVSTLLKQQLASCLFILTSGVHCRLNAQVFWTKFTVRLKLGNSLGTFWLLLYFQMGRHTSRLIWHRPEVCVPPKVELGMCLIKHNEVESHNMTFLWSCNRLSNSTPSSSFHESRSHSSSCSSFPATSMEAPH